MASSSSNRGGIEPAAACPSCQSDEAPKRPTFTWWGGLVGPKLLNHAVCANCGTGYNAKTGKSNTGPIVAYVAVAFVLCLALFGALALAR